MPDKADQILTPALLNALGLTAKTLSWKSLREALGMHAPPEQIARIMADYSDGLPVPVLPEWVDGEISSRYSLPFLDLSPEEQLITKNLRDALRKQPLPVDWLDELQQLLHSYPHVPVLYNLEVMYYRTIGDLDRWRTSSEALLKRFPGYIFATVTLASYYLSLQQPEKVPHLFHDQLELVDFDPEERVFEASEVSSFYGVMAWYHLYELRLMRAALCISLVHASRPNDPFLNRLMAWLLQFPEHVLLELRRILREG